MIETPDARRQTPVIRRYSDLVAWQRAMSWVEEVYRVTKLFPKEELYGLTSQLRRSAVSVPSNIAEGYCRNGRKEFAHRLSIALGSLGELEIQVLIAERLHYVENSESARILEMATETGRILVGLMNSLEKHAAAS